MQAQVPIWVPLVVAVLGVVGILLGQVVNGLNERRRFTLQAEREDRVYWREKRIDAYAELVASVSACTAKAQLFNKFLVKEYSNPTIDTSGWSEETLEEFYNSNIEDESEDERLGSAFAAVQIRGSRDFMALARETHLKWTEYRALSKALLLVAHEGGEFNSDDVEQLENFIEELVTMRARLLWMARDELERPLIIQ